MSVVNIQYGADPRLEDVINALSRKLLKEFKSYEDIANGIKAVLKVVLRKYGIKPKISVMNKTPVTVIGWWREGEGEHIIDINVKPSWLTVRRVKGRLLSKKLYSANAYKLSYIIASKAVHTTLSRISPYYKKRVPYVALRYYFERGGDTFELMSCDLEAGLMEYEKLFAIIPLLVVIEFRYKQRYKFYPVERKPCPSRNT